MFRVADIEPNGSCEFVRIIIVSETPDFLRKSRVGLLAVERNATLNVPDDADNISSCCLILCSQYVDVIGTSQALFATVCVSSLSMASAALLFANARKLVVAKRAFHGSRSLQKETLEQFDIFQDGRTETWKTRIDSCNADGFVVNGNRIRGSVLLFPGMGLRWNVKDISQMSEDSLCALAIVKPTIGKLHWPPSYSY